MVTPKDYVNQMRVVKATDKKSRKKPKKMRGIIVNQPLKGNLELHKLKLALEKEAK